MKRSIVFILAAFFTVGFSFGQDKKSYPELIKEAADLYGESKFLESGQKYSEAFESLGGKGIITDRYNAACAWALANEKDSAFFNLFKVVNTGRYFNLDHLSNDTDLESLRTDPRWEELIGIVHKNMEKLDKPLVRQLDSIYEEDQKYRAQIEEIAGKYGHNSDEMRAHWQLINEKDSINLIKVSKILDERGWLGADVVGEKGNRTLFLVIQHADQASQEKYLPMMRDAVSKGNAKPADLALLEDRIALKQGRRQIYGSQIGMDASTGEYFVHPLDDPENVDERRASVGLGSFREYLSIFGMTWDAEEYKKKLPEIESKQMQFK